MKNHLLYLILTVFIISCETEETTNESTLQSITINGEELSKFSTDTSDYTVMMSTAPASISIQAVATNKDAEVTITNPETVPGIGEISVTASDGVGTSTYNLNFTTLPAKDAFLIDFTEFPSKKKSSSVNAADTSNYGVSAYTVGACNIFIGLGMVVPVLTFAESFNHVPEMMSITHWKWSYSIKTPLKGTYTNELHAYISDSITWEMYISNNFEGATNFKWYMGKMDFLGTGGYWKFQKSAEENVTLLQIDWKRNFTDSTASIKYSNIEPDGDENGGYVGFEKSLDEPFNMFYEIFNKGENNLVTIQWSDKTMAGQVKNEKFFSDTEFHCWDSSLTNIDCQ